MENGMKLYYTNLAKYDLLDDATFGRVVKHLMHIKSGYKWNVKPSELKELDRYLISSHLKDYDAIEKWRKFQVEQKNMLSDALVYEEDEAKAREQYQIDMTRKIANEQRQNMHQSRIEDNNMPL